MLWKCSYCEKTFDTKDGGSLCPICHDAACPDCEEKKFAETENGSICISCSEEIE